MLNKTISIRPDETRIFYFDSRVCVSSLSCYRSFHSMHDHLNRVPLPHTKKAISLSYHKMFFCMESFCQPRHDTSWNLPSHSEHHRCTAPLDVDVSSTAHTKMYHHSPHGICSECPLRARRSTETRASGRTRLERSKRSTLVISSTDLIPLSMSPCDCESATGE